VLVGAPDIPAQIREATVRADLRLALDGVSGPATGVLAATLSPGGTLVVYAEMSLAPISVSPLDVIFKPLTLRGFFMGHPEFADKMPLAAKEAATMIASGSVRVPVAATYPLSEIMTVKPRYRSRS
jgi:NADPH:quinone reductase-like Zn-dependent oxidoreductase